MNNAKNVFDFFFCFFCCWQWKPESIKIHFEQPRFFATNCKKILYVRLAIFPNSFCNSKSDAAMPEQGKKLWFHFINKSFFFILTFWNVNVHKTNEREMLANVISMENKQNLLRSERHRKKRNNLISLNNQYWCICACECECVLLILSVNHLKRGFFFTRYLYSVGDRINSLSAFDMHA